MRRSTPPTRARWLAGLVTAALATGACAVVSLVAATPASALANGLAKAPPMGFNDWNSFGCAVDEQLIEQTADYFVSSGLKAAGYNYVNIDDCWLLKARSADGHLVPDPVKFPDGIKGTADYVHSLGLKLGIYEDAGTKTCAGYPGSLGHEQTDANDFAAWGVDYLKYDNCNNQSNGSLADYKARYTAMGDALKKTGRPIVYSICEWGVNDPATWAGDIGNLWRTTGDINDSWGSLKSIINQNLNLYPYAKPGAWNDPDMLEVGNGHMTDTEYKTHFGLWAEMAAPLLIGTDLRKATPATLSILLNKDVIAIDQDKLGVQGQVIAQGNGTMVFNKPLKNGDRAVALYNSNDAAATMSTTAAQIGLTRSTAYSLKDVWSGTTTETAGTISAVVPAHGTALYRVKAVSDYRKFAPATTLGVTSPSSYTGADIGIAAGATTTFASTISDYGRDALTDVRLTADAPDGWSVAATSAWSAKRVKTNGSFATGWSLSSPATAQPGNYGVTLTASYAYGTHRPVAVTRHVVVQIVPTPPHGSVALSDVTWVSSTNGWGPVEKDLSNGETAAGDGKPISIRGTVYPKGLGTNAQSDIVYYVGGKCSSLTTDVGIDDEVGTKGGDVLFQIFADDAKVADSGKITNTSAVKSLTANLTGVTWLRLHVDPDGATTYDHGDWAGPQLTCS
ncbi:MAG: alpha-galactosidase [Pseudonocardiales bacterium]|nr:alpha-galactosidase [Pseudonocardiales bacterium]